MSDVDNMKKFHPVVFELSAPKAVIEGVFIRSYCCYDNLLCCKNDNNVLINDWAVFYAMLVASSDRVVITTHENVSAGNCIERPYNERLVQISK